MNIPFHLSVTPTVALLLAANLIVWSLHFYLRRLIDRSTQLRAKTVQVPTAGISPKRFLHS